MGDANTDRSAVDPAPRDGPRRAAAFAALRYPNYRLWFVGQAVSLMGTWMQSVAQGWVVYQLTGSRLALGVISFAGTIPTLFLMLPAGAVADRISRRRLLVATQTAMMLCAFILAALAGTGTLRVWHIGVLAFALGIANSFDAPARQTLAVEMVEDRRDLMNAIALNSTIFNLARIIGPAIGGVVLATLGATWCFALNGISFLAVIVALARMRLPDTPHVGDREPLTAQISAGLRYVAGSVPTRTMLALVGMASFLGLSYATLMPVFAVDVLHVGETGLGALNTTVGVGALCGSLTVAAMGPSRGKARLLTAGSLLFPLALIIFGSSRSLPLSLVCLATVGYGLVVQNATSNTLIQTLVSDELRGRVMAVFSLMIFGASPFGSLLAGGLAEALGPSQAVLITASASLAFSVLILVFVPTLRRLDL